MSQAVTIRASSALVAALFMGLAVVGCFAPTHGTVAVYVRSEPTEEFTRVEITVTHVEVQRAGAGIGDGPGTGADRGAGEPVQDTGTGFTTVSSATRGLDLLEFQEPDSRAFLGSSRAPEGAFSLVVIRLAEAEGVLRDDGSRVELQMATNEIRQLQEFTVEAGETTRLVLTLDLEASISQDDDGWRLSPQVTVQVEPRADGREEDRPDRGV